MEWASFNIEALHDAIDLSEATPDEIATLKEWRQYRVKLNRIESSPVQSSLGWPNSISWPAPPVK
ncbi:tail fiber assembly protein [Pseudomonas sp. NFXW11]|uniref:tail fiber assembly protein n=1 Tax=Pseudomonas sp. NFXW11 TaxID=2819531 RepID=UPI003CE9E59A